jgi:PLP dependent protein
MSIADNLRRVRERMARAAELSGRPPGEVLLVGVTKYVEAQQAIDLAAAGCTDLGESRPQELWDKAAALAGDVAAATGRSSANVAIRWHLVGHLQRNKVRRTLPLVSLIHSVDSERLLAAINDAATEGDTRPAADVLLEVNISGEAAKHGLAPADVEPLIDAASRYPRVAIRGLMTMAALEGGEQEAARNFAALRGLRDHLQLNAPERVRLDELSMGMSGDFEIAIREGATIIRVGSALWD